MSTLWKNDRIVEDRFIVVDDVAPLPREAAVLVSLDRWRKDHDALAARDGAVGVTVPATADLDPATDDLARVALIVIPFAKFSDGRGYSIARRLRDTHGYAGELRASGDVLIDQIPLMLRCGFDAFAITHAPTLRALEAGKLPAIPEVYQAAVRGRARSSRPFAPRSPLLAAE